MKDPRTVIELVGLMCGVPASEIGKLPTRGCPRKSYARDLAATVLHSLGWPFTDIADVFGMKSHTPLLGCKERLEAWPESLTSPDPAGLVLIALALRDRADTTFRWQERTPHD